MKPVPFTRFHQPNGRQENTTIDVPDEIHAQWQKVEAAGLRMTVELLPTGLVSQCIEHPELGDFDMELTKNGPEVVTGLYNLLNRFDPAVVPAWIKEMSE